MSEQYLLGIDIGTSSIKVGAISLDGKFICLEKKEHQIISPNQGWFEIPIDILWRNFIECLEMLITNKGIDTKKIKAIGISCLCPGLIPMDANGEALHNPIIYMDQRSVHEVKDIEKIIGEKDFFDSSGNRIISGTCSLTSMLWIKNNKKEIYEKTKYFGHINTFFVHKLTGKWGIDYTNASYTGLFETKKKGNWAEKIAVNVGIDTKKLPPLIPSDKVAGYLKSHQLLDLNFNNIPVAMGGADTACSALALGIIDNNQVFESVGTTNVLTICSTTSNFNNKFLNRCHVINGKWLYHGAMSSTGASIEWFKQEFCKDLLNESNENIYRKLDELAKGSPPGANGIIFLPYMAGERTPIWDYKAKGMLFGLTLKTKRNDIIRAILEGCGYGLKQIIDISQEITHSKLENIISVGGGAKSDVWGQIRADITGKVIQAMSISDTAVIGAALLAGMALGAYTDEVEAVSFVEKRIIKEFYPLKCNKDVYDNNADLYNSIYPRLADLF